MNLREESSDGFAVNELHGFRIKIFNCLRTGKNLPFSAASVKAGFSCVVTIYSFSTFIPLFVLVLFECLTLTQKWNLPFLLPKPA